MPSLMVFIAPLALAASAPQAAAEAPPVPPPAGIWEQVADAFRTEPVQQVRIEQRMTIRITPLGPSRELLADLPRAPLASRFAERKIGKCVPIAGIAGVQIGGDDRLMLFMRDQRLIGVNLEKACRARDFYSGFYVERGGDGRLCVDRDMIRSRSGASCSLSRMRQLVAVDE